MGEGKQIGRYLQPSESIGVYSIGAEFVRDTNKHIYDPGGAETLRLKTINLQNSDHIDDRAAVTSINKFFARNDYLEAAGRLNDTLETPLRKDIIPWMSCATDRDIEEFCRWNLLRTWHLTKSLHRDKPKLVAHTMEKTHQLTNIGLFPPTAIPVIEAAADRSYFQGIDSFHSGGENATAFCMNNTIGFSNQYHSRRLMRFISPKLSYVTLHEVLHAAGSDRGFSQGIRQRSPTYLRFLEEAFVEHATVVAHAPENRESRIIDPNKRMNGHTGYNWYTAERTLLATTVEHAEIEWEQLSEAYFAPRGDERGEFLREDIERKIGKLFGTLGDFYDFVRDYENAAYSERPQLIGSKITDLTTPAAA